MNNVGQLLHLTIVGPWEIRTLHLLRVGRFYTYANGPELPGGNVLRRDCCAGCAAWDPAGMTALAKIWWQEDFS